mgnify:CR=1 FL=1
MIRTSTILAMTMALSMVGTALGEDFAGTWARGDGVARVKIARCGTNVCATNTWIKPGTPDEKKGDVLVMTVAPASAGQYTGSAFDPQRNMTFKISMSVNGDRMTTKGCVLGGMLCKGVSWSRVK